MDTSISVLPAWNSVQLYLRIFWRMGLTEDPIVSRFQHHVSFDNFAGGEPTAKNSMSFTLNVKHRGYQRKRRSRTFMVGVDENDYSDIALSWMLEELVDDGDEIICLRVVDRDAKVVNDRNVDKKTYQEEAKKLMERIQSRNDENRAISIVLEFAVGKVHNVFQKMVSLVRKLSWMAMAMFLRVLADTALFRFSFTNLPC